MLPATRKARQPGRRRTAGGCGRGGAHRRPGPPASSQAPGHVTRARLTHELRGGFGAGGFGAVLLTAVACLLLAPQLAAPQGIEPDVATSPYAGVAIGMNPIQGVVGVGVFHTALLGAFGLYVDVRRTTSPLDRRSSFDPERGASEDLVPPRFQHMRTLRDWESMNGAVTRAVTSHLLLYAGGGVSRRRTFEEWLDHEDETRDGIFVIPSGAGSELRPNVTAGFFLQTGRMFLLQGGIDAAPVGAWIGAALAFPR